MFQNNNLQELVKKHREHKLAHAYLLETNNIEYATKDIKELIKIINCNNEFNENCTKCNLCNLIDKNNLPSLKIIEPDGASIKKNQVENLKLNFETLPVYSKYNIYIIKNAEKLNPSSANSMLKFVEEPTEGIIGFFITSNKDIMIDTIKSRCQSLVLNYDNNSILDILNITDEQYEKYREVAKNYLQKLNSANIINNKNEVLSIFPERKDIENLLKIILEVYYQYFLKLINKEYNKEITKIYLLTQPKSTISKNLQIISQTLEDLSYNVNIELLLDKFVIEMRGTNG